MKQLQCLGLVALVTAAACTTTETVAPPGERSADRPPSMALIEGHGVAPPANDIPESQRRAWLDAQRPPVEDVRVEREVIVERRPVRYERDYDRDDRWEGWYLPVSLSLGYWGGSHGHRGWSWGLGWNSGWRRGCGW